MAFLGMAQIRVKCTAKGILALHDVQCSWAILILFFFLLTSYENFDHTMIKTWKPRKCKIYNNNIIIRTI